MSNSSLMVLERSCVGYYRDYLGNRAKLSAPPTQCSVEVHHWLEGGTFGHISASSGRNLTHEDSLNWLFMKRY